jgi:hypothetical protein
MTRLNDIETKIKSKIAVGNKCPILKRRSISQSIKIRLYKMIIRPTVTYGAETLTLTSKTEKNVNDMGEKDIKENIWINKGEWTVENQNNSELITKYKSQDIVTVIKIRRLEWLGYVIRMNKARSLKKIFEGKLEGRRSR